MGRIVVGVDGSAHSVAALRWAVDEARLRGSTVEAVISWQLPYDAYVPASGMPTPTEMNEDFSARLAEIVEDEGLADLDEPVVVARAMEGPPAAALIAAADGAELLVVGSRGRGAFMGMVLGSVSLHCVSHAPCPTVVVPLATD